MTNLNIMELKKTPPETKINIKRILDNKGLHTKLLRCAKCKHLLPLKACSTCVACNKLFCQDCTKLLSKRGKCKCKREINFKWENFYSKLGNIELSCDYQNLGCQKTILYKNLESHQKECKFMPIDCPTCSNSFIKKDIERHAMSCLDTEIKCINCDFQSTRKNHDHVCHEHNFYKYYTNKSLDYKLNVISDLINLVRPLQDQIQSTAENIDIVVKNLIFKLEKSKDEIEERASKIIFFDF